MNPSPKSPNQELTDALSDNEKLRKSLKDCQNARTQAEEESARYLEAARSAIEELQQFSYAASHDLKQPLRSISLYAELLQRQYGQNEQASEFTSFILEGVAQMNELIEALLTYSQIGPPARRSAVKLTSVLQWALFNIEPLIRESGAQITYGDLPVVAVDDMAGDPVTAQLAGHRQAEWRL